MDLIDLIQQFSLQQNGLIILLIISALIGILIAFVIRGHKINKLADNAIKIRELRERLYKRLNVFTSHLAKLGPSLNTTVDSFNKTAGLLECQVMPSGKRFFDMGIRAKNEIDSIPEIETQTRSVKEDTDV